MVAINFVNFSFVSDSYPMGQNTNYFFNVRNRSTAKQTGPLTSSLNRIAVNQLKHVPLVISRHQSCPSNIIMISLHSFEPNRPNDVECLGSIGFHIYDIIDSSPWASSFEFWNDTYLVGMLELEFTFNYGSFGYGHSIQVKKERERD